MNHVNGLSVQQPLCADLDEERRGAQVAVVALGPMALL